MRVAARLPRDGLGALGAHPISHRWTTGNVGIPGAAVAICQITPAEPDDAGEYTAEVSNTCGSLLSAPAARVVEEGDCPPT